MSASNRFWEDCAKVANSALNVAAGMRDEVWGAMRHRVERLVESMNLVPREEFEVVREMAALARAEQEKLAVRVGELEKLDARVSELEKLAMRVSALESQLAAVAPPQPDMAAQGTTPKPEKPKPEKPARNPSPRKTPERKTLPT